jgi:CheY-like chemotaxis protein
LRLENTLPDLLSQPVQVLAQLQRRAERLSFELARLKKQIASDAPPITLPAVQLRGHETILIADDHPVVRSMAQEILEGFGYRILLADSNLHDVPRSRTLDLVLLNVPLLSAEYLHRVSLAKKLAAKLMVSTLLPEGVARVQLRTLGVDDFVSKPYQPLTLASCVRRTLELSR